MDEDRCEASSWRGNAKKHDPYGPGGYNRCTKKKGGKKPHTKHEDSWGNVFVLFPSFRVLYTQEMSRG